MNEDEELKQLEDDEENKLNNQQHNQHFDNYFFVCSLVNSSTFFVIDLTFTL